MVTSAISDTLNLPVPTEKLERRGSSGSVMSFNSAHPKYIPPWTTPYIIGVGGPSGSGKTSVASKIVSLMDVPWTVLVSLDNFYHPLDVEERERAFNNQYDFDEPSAIDLDLAYECILSLKEGKKTDIPVYSFVNHNRVPGKSITIYGASVIVLEGIYALHDKRLLDLMDLKVYVDADLDICLARRLSRDIISRGRDLHGCIDQWERFVKPNAVKFVKPTMNNADAIVPSMTDNNIAVRLLVDHIQTKLEKRSEEHINELNNLSFKGSGSKFTVLKENSQIIEIEHTSQVKAMLTILLDKKSERDDFVFYFDRLAMIILSRAMDDLPIIENQSITTASEYPLDGLIRCKFDQITVVSLIRSGDCFMSSMRKTVPNISVGKLLIQSDSLTGEPQLHGDFLQGNVASYEKVLLLYGQVISGASMIMAIQVLLDNGVKLENITITIFISTEIGLMRVVNAFGNKIKIVVGKIVTTEDIKNGNCKWAVARFVDARYFGCK